MSDLDPLLSFGEFDAVSLPRWREAAEKALGASLGSVARTVGQVEVPPLFADDDRPQGSRPLWTAGGWGVGQEIAASDVGEIAARLGEARGGLEVAWVELEGSHRAGCAAPVDWGGARLSSARALGPVVDAARASGIAVVVRADAAAPSVLDAWCELDPSARALAGVVSDPLGTLAQLGARGSSLREAHAALASTTRIAIAIAKRGPAHVQAPAGHVASGSSTEPPPIVTVLADGVPWHDAGATPAVALGAAVAAGLSHLQGLADHGIAHSEAAPHVALRLSLGSDLFESIAMLRAARLVWGACLQRLGASCAPRIWARTSLRDRSRLDVSVNLLRNTLAAFAGAVGGVEQLYVQPHTEACGRDDADARRWARNIQHVLRGESRLDVVADPSAGSPYIEHLTRALAADAWHVARSLSAPDPEAALVAALENPDALLRRRARAMVGVDLHPDPRPPEPEVVPGRARDTLAREPVVVAPALSRERWAAPHERVRDRAAAWVAAQPQPGIAAAISIPSDCARPVRDAAQRLAGLLGLPLHDSDSAAALRIEAAAGSAAVIRFTRSAAALDLAATLDRGADGLCEILDRLEATP